MVYGRERPLSADEGDDEDGDAMATEEEEADQAATGGGGGGNSDRGLIPRSIEQIFAARDAVGRVCKLSLDRIC